MSPGFSFRRFCLRGLAGLALGLVVTTPFVLQGCGSNAADPGTGGAGGGGGGDTDGGPGGTGGGGPGEPEVPISVCPKDPIKTLAGTGARDSASQPAIAWAGNGYLVVWGDARGQAIYGAMVDPKGMPVGGIADFMIADTPGAAGSPEVAALPTPGAGFIVAFEACDPANVQNCGVATIILGSDGRPTTADPVMVAPPIILQRRPYVVTGHDRIYIAYRDKVATHPRPVARVAVLDATGAQMGPGVLADMDSGQYPHVAVSDAATSKVAVVYQREKTTTEDIVLTVLDQDLANPAEVPIRTGVPGEASNPVVNWNVDSWVVAWEDARVEDQPRIYAAVVNGATNAVGTSREAYDENGNWPTIATGGRKTSLIGFYGYPGERVFLSRISADTGLRPGQVVLDTGKFPAVAYNPVSTNDEYAVVYETAQAKNVMFATFTCASAQ